MIQEGIYLEESRGTVGTGGTAKPIVYRNLWATREILEEAVLLQLLDDKAAPTALTEKVSLRELAERFVYRPVSPELWAALRTRMDSCFSPRAESGQYPEPKLSRG